MYLPQKRTPNRTPILRRLIKRFTPAKKETFPTQTMSPFINELRKVSVNWESIGNFKKHEMKSQAAPLEIMGRPFTIEAARSVIGNTLNVTHESQNQFLDKKRFLVLFDP